MKSFLFRIRYAFKNVIKNAGRSLVILFTLTITMGLFVTVLTMNDAFRQVYFTQGYEKYINIDLTLTYDSNSDSRIINKRNLLEHFSSYFDFAGSFFNYYSLTETGEASYYSQVFSGTVSDFETVIDYNLGSLGFKGTFITGSMAQEYSLSVGDQISIFVADRAILYTVKKIIPDHGLFTGKSLFVDKTELLHEIYGFSSLSNLGNIIYFNLKEGTNPEDFITILENDAEYGDFVAAMTVDPAKAELAALNTSAMFIGVIGVTLIALILVLNSIFPLLFKDFRSQIGIIQVLGGSQAFSLSVWMLQFAMYSVLAIPLGIFVAWYALNEGASIAGILSSIILPTWKVGLAVAGFIVIIGGEILYRYSRLAKQSSIALTYDRRYERTKRSRIILPAAVLLLAAEMLFRPFDEKINTAVTLILGLIVSFSFISFALDLYAGFSIKKKHLTLFTLFGAKNMKNNLVIHNSLKIAMISTLVIVLTLTVRSFITGETNAAMEEIRADYFLTNIVDYSEELKTRIASEYETEFIEETITYQNVYVNFTPGVETDRRKIRFVISLPYEELSTYFEYVIDDGVSAQFADTEIAYIALPVPVGKIYGLEVGDAVTLELSREIPMKTFIVAGFIHTNFTNIAFTNLCNLTEYQDGELFNTILIRSSDDGIKTGLMKEYNARMYYLIDIDEMIVDSVKELFNLSDYLSFISYAIAFAFIFVIINNSLLVFYSLKSEYAKIKVLGVSTSELFIQIGHEVLVMVLIISLASFAFLLLLIPNLGPLMLFLRYYKDIRTDVPAVLLRVMIGSLAFLIGYGSYFFKARSMNVIQEIKKY
jgi:hypothetical protein